MRPPAAVSALLAFLVCILAAVNISAATLVVTKTEDTNDGICDADCSLREAVAVANADDTVVFSSLFNSTQMITLTLGQIAITRNLTIIGTGQETLSISGNDAGRIFYISGGPVVTLTEMTLRDGRNTNLEAFGGGIFADASTLNMTGIVMTNNYVQYDNPPLIFGYGGAIYIRNGTMNVESSEFRNNTALNGAGIFNGSSILNITNSSVSSNSGQGLVSTGNVPVTVMNSIFDNNSATGIQAQRISVLNSTISNNRRGGIGSGDAASEMTIDHCLIADNLNISLPNRDGGGIGNFGTAYIRYSSITNNRATGNGGGIDNGGTMYIENSTVMNNRAQLSGGGGFNVIGQLFVTNSTFSGNIAVEMGGGIYNTYDATNTNNGRVYLTNSTLAFNSATGRGGGLRQDSMGMATIRNTIIANNTSGANEPDVSGGIVSEGFNMVGSTTGGTGWLGSDLLNIDPLLAPLGSNGGSTHTHALRLKSPAINAGSNELAVDPLTKIFLTTDQRESNRVIGGTVDIGAYEANYAMGPVTVSGRIATVGGRGVLNVRVMLTNDTTTFYARTNPFGYFRFVGLTPGTTYTVALMHKYYLFDTPQYVTADQNRSDLDFVSR